MAPAIPAQAAPMINAIHLISYGINPMASAAISSSLMEIHARPWADLTKFERSRTVPTVKINSQVQLINWGFYQSRCTVGNLQIEKYNSDYFRHSQGCYGQIIPRSLKVGNPTRKPRIAAATALRLPPE